LHWGHFFIVTFFFLVWRTAGGASPMESVHAAFFSLASSPYSSSGDGMETSG
jgi:hypothetical protein